MGDVPTSSPHVLPSGMREELFKVLMGRFMENMSRHEGLEWVKVQKRLESYPEKLWAINEMEKTGGEPDVVDYDEETSTLLFMDCSPQSPQGRRNTCYDRKAQDEREKKGVYPAGNVIDMAKSIGVEVLTEEQYRGLQRLGEFDTKTQSWVKKPEKIRKLGGAIFMDRRYDHVFLYHNSAPSFYSSRGFRGLLRV